MNAKSINNVVVVGAGTMGEGIAQNFAEAGLSVKLVARHQESLDSAMAVIDANLHVFEEYGLLRENIPQIKSRISTVRAQFLDQAIRNCDYILETIPEVLDAKKESLAQIEAINPDVIIGSNTSSFTITELSQGMKNPGRLVGVHYFNPAHIIPVVEIHRGEKTTDETVNISKTFLQSVGKKPVMVRKIVPGFIVNRLTGAIEREIDYLLDNGIVTPEDLDIAVKGSIGFRLACLGPMEVEDMIGLDIAARVSGRIFKVLSNADGPSPDLVAKVNKGELGIKSGKGWYDYTSKLKTEVLDEKNRKLLQQLALYKSREK